jgi:hypothetical protein
MTLDIRFFNESVYISTNRSGEIIDLADCIGSRICTSDWALGRGRYQHLRPTDDPHHDCRDLIYTWLCEDIGEWGEEQWQEVWKEGDEVFDAMLHHYAARYRALFVKSRIERGELEKDSI